MASTPSLMKVSTWLIWVLTSLVPSATWSSTSSYWSAAFRAASVMPAIQPWSAAGAENPMVTVSPASSLSLTALLPPLSPELSGSLPVQPAIRTPAPMSATVVDARRRYPRCLVADIFSPRVSPPWRRRQVVGGVSCGGSGRPGGLPGGADPRRVRSWARPIPRGGRRRGRRGPRCPLRSHRRGRRVPRRPRPARIWSGGRSPRRSPAASAAGRRGR